MRPKARAAALDIEQAVLAEHHLDDDAFERHIPSRQGPWRVDGARRPLRWPITDARLSRIDDGAARLEFALPPGGYATEVVRALGGEIVRP
jgi:tRNA(Glu) U13 pseudouridine synthase TruD